MYPAAGKYVPIGNKEIDRSSLESDEDLPFSPRSHRAKFGLFMKLVLFTLALLFSFLAIIGALDLLQWLPESNSIAKRSGSPCYCGNSAQEARSLGCKYVPMAAAWLPAHCRDETLENEFNTLGPNPDHSWTYWADYGMTSTIDLETIENFAGTYTRFYNEWEWHVLHCMFYWRKLHRSQFSNIVIEPRFNRDSHISHCTRLILSRNVTSTTVSGVSMGDEYFSEHDITSPASWNDIRDGYGNNPPAGYLNGVDHNNTQ